MSTIDKAADHGEGDEEPTGGRSAPLAAPLQVNRWRRYGRDLVYVSNTAGEKVGVLDLVSGKLTVEIAALDDELKATLRNWCAEGGVLVPASLEENAELAHQPPPPAAVATPPPPPPPPAGLAVLPAPPPPPPELATPPSPPAIVEEPDWVDLAANRAGEAARAQAIELKKERPVLTFVARVFDLKTDERAWRIGADGEQMTAYRLRKLADGWHLLHAVPVGDRGSDIDHVAVGPGGVFTINTKHHPGAKIWIAERTFMVSGQRQPYLRNSRHEASRASKLLTAACGFEVPVEPIISLICAEITMKAEPEGVHVMSFKRLRRWLERRPVLFSPEQVEAIYMKARRSDTWTT